MARILISFVKDIPVRLDCFVRSSIGRSFIFGSSIKRVEWGVVVACLGSFVFGIVAIMVDQICIILITTSHFNQDGPRSRIKHESHRSNRKQRKFHCHQCMAALTA